MTSLLKVGAIAVLLVALAACESSSSNQAAASTSTAKTTIPTIQIAYANIQGISHGGFDPDYVSCSLNGNVAGEVFHGTLSGPNIGTNKFDVTAGQPSNGQNPTSATDGIFALKYPGQGPQGPFTCTLTAVDAPQGSVLASHQASDWTLTVT